MSEVKQGSLRDAVIEKFQKKDATVGVIGLGYVGLPLILEIDASGFRTLGFDVDEIKVARLNTGKSYIHHIPSNRIADLRKGNKFEATTDYDRLVECDGIIICVPTPLNEHREPDLTYVEQSAKEIAKRLRSGQLVILESTTFPGTTAEHVLPPLAECGLQVGKDFFLVYSPEREDPGNAKFTTRTIPKVMGGTTPDCLLVGRSLYDYIFDTIVPVSSTGAAEMTKLLENIYRAVNIALVNELKMLTTRMGLDIWEIIEASATKPFGFQPFYPGPGLGGHCIPIDPFYLTWKAREFDFSTRFIELAGEINTGMPRFVIERLVEGLSRNGKACRGARVLVLGVAYKKDVDDVRESPALKVVDLLLHWGCEVTYHDPYIPEYPKTRHGDLGPARSVDLTEKAVTEADAVLILTNHSCIDYQWVVDHAKLVIDSRYATKYVQQGREKIVKA